MKKIMCLIEKEDKSENIVCLIEKEKRVECLFFYFKYLNFSPVVK